MHGTVTSRPMRQRWTLPAIKYVCAALNVGTKAQMLARKFGTSTDNMNRTIARYLIRNAREYVINDLAVKNLLDVPMLFSSGAPIELDDLEGVDVNKIVAPGTPPSPMIEAVSHKPVGKETIMISAVLLHNYDKEAEKLTKKGQKFSNGRRLIEKLLLILNDNPTYIHSIIDDDSEDA
jgi:hypothetical protein